MRTLYYFTVTGSGNFPFEMLALDEAWPAGIGEAEKIYMACPTQAREQNIGFASYRHPNTVRWREKKWPVLRVHA